MLEFKNSSSLVKHFLKHKDDTNTMSKEDYLANAKKILGSGFLISPAKDGKYKFTLPTTNEVLVVDPLKRKILTYYIKKAYLEGTFKC